jgi:transcriptional regulator with XRE-family HTH domain
VDAGLTLTEAAAGLGLDRQFLGDIEHNRHSPDARLDARLRAFYRKPLSLTEMEVLEDFLERLARLAGNADLEDLRLVAIGWRDRLRGILEAAGRRP